MPEYSEEDYKKLRRKIDRYLLPLMWLCYGIQQTDKTSLGTQATFGLREVRHHLLEKETIVISSCAYNHLTTTKEEGEGEEKGSQTDFIIRTPGWSDSSTHG